MSIKYNRTVKSERTAENHRMRIDRDIIFDSEIPNNHEIKNTSKNYFLPASLKGLTERGRNSSGEAHYRK
jgi:hypothetical protein